MPCHDGSNLSRRRFIQLAATAAAASSLLTTAARAADLPRLDPTDPAAQALGYELDTRTVSSSAYPSHGPMQECGTCNFYKGSAGAEWGLSLIFRGKDVSLQGWCSAYISPSSELQEDSRWNQTSGGGRGGHCEYTGCASTSPNVYSQREAMRVAEVSEGTVVSLRAVQIAGDETPWVGAGVGAVLGGLAGNAISSGHGAGTVLGAVAGGLGGAVIEQQATRKEGVELTIRLDSGRTVAVTQHCRRRFESGTHVRLVSQDGRNPIDRGDASGMTLGAGNTDMSAIARKPVSVSTGRSRCGDPVAYNDPACRRDRAHMFDQLGDATRNWGR